MSEKPAAQPASEPVVAKPDPYDLATLRLDPSFLETAGVKKVLATFSTGTDRTGTLSDHSGLRRAPRTP